MPRKKKDLAEKQTDALLDELEKRIVEEYETALKGVQEKYDRFAARFAEEEKEKKKLFDDGKITFNEFMGWKRSKLLSGSRYKQLLDTLASDLAMADQKAMSIANGYMPEAYALNFNYTTYEIEMGVNANTGFALYSRETVEKLVRQNEISLPKRKVDIPLDQQWNRKHLDSAILQGVLQGDSIPKISKRLQQVTDMDRKASIRNARTMMTGAQNGGRMSAYERAANLGIKIQKEWMATLDSRTRDSHQKMDGERVDWKKPFSNKLMYPGDPEGDPSEVYNCRCTMVPFYPDFESAADKRITYQEWVKGKDGIQKEGPFDINKIQHSSAGENLLDILKTRKVEYKEVQRWDKQPTEQEIIERLGGGDMTSGSCLSLACAYIGNKSSLDVIDFRGGASCNVFALSHRYLVELPVFKQHTTIEQGSTINPTKKLLKLVEKGKEYMLITGRHAAIVRKNDENILQYLELQSSSDNGWTNFERDYVMYKGYAGYERTVHRTLSDTLKRRFGCDRGTSWDISSLTDITGLTADDEFREILGYINTDVSKQKKGSSGNVK